jgi:hypothetical protein
MEVNTLCPRICCQEGADTLTARMRVETDLELPCSPGSDVVLDRLFQFYPIDNRQHSDCAGGN